MKTCSKCSIEKHIDDFRKYINRKSHVCKRCSNDQRNIRRTINTSYKEKDKNSAYVRKYGSSIEEYNVLLDKQKGLCAICNTEEKITNKSLALDHCHTTGKVRGLLCYKCNVALGFFNDNINNLNNAIQYLGGICE